MVRSGKTPPNAVVLPPGVRVHATLTPLDAFPRVATPSRRHTTCPIFVPSFSHHVADAACWFAEDTCRLHSSCYAAPSAVPVLPLTYH